MISNQLKSTLAASPDEESRDPRSLVEPGGDRSRTAPLILIVDDERTMRMLLRRAMEKEGYRVAEAVNGEQGIELYKSLKPKIVLLDAIMPVLDGFACCEKMMTRSTSERMQDHWQADRTPILIITALEDPESVDRAYAAGAADYVTKPIHWPVLRQRVRRLIQQVELFEQLEAANQQLQRLASLDGLTQLANRRCFDRVLEREWHREIRESWGAREPAFVSLIMCDVDHFKLYNDTYGHQAGDACLQQVARALQAAARRASDLVARYGGEEFALILPNTDASGAIHVAEEIRSHVKKCAIAHSSSPVSPYVTLSLGVATITPKSDTEPATLIAAADRALYQAKATGRDRVFFNE
ncbi:MAG: diguanylate cyclase [Hormoscilla sp.]